MGWTEAQLMNENSQLFVDLVTEHYKMQNKKTKLKR